ncbi:helix-turn-helix transcriptional regulator [Clostridium botulinum]|nr:helix-turn-helix transcriptional regulator [Clostridium botulinum]
MIKMKLHMKLAEKRITRKQLAKDTNVRLATISGYCNDNFKMLSRDHLNTFCRYFNCDISDLIEFVNDDED